MGLFGDRDLPDGAGDCPPIGQGYFNFTELAQDLLRAVSLSRHLYPLFRTRVSNIQTGSAFGGHVKVVVAFKRGTEICNAKCPDLLPPGEGVLG